MTHCIRANGRVLLAIVLCAGVSGCNYQDYSGVSDPTSNAKTVTCLVTRRECRSRNANGCTSWPSQADFTAVTCDKSDDASNDATCRRVFCSRTDGLLYSANASECTATAIPVTAYTPTTPGICKPDPQSTNRAQVTYKQRYQICTTGANQLACASISSGAISSEITECVDVSEASAALELLPATTLPTGLTPSQIVNGSVQITSFVPNNPDCPLAGPATGAQALNYVPTPGSVGTVSGAGVTVPLTATQGIASLQTYAGGYYSTIEQFEMSLADVSVVGTSLSALTVRSVGPVVVGWDGTIASGGMKLLAMGKLNGANVALPMVNSTPWTAIVGTSQLALNGAINILAEDALRKSLPVTATVSATMPLATPAQVVCASASPGQRLFGFEDRALFSSSNAVLSLMTTPVTQGCGALGISGQGYMTIAASNFSTAGLVLKPALSVDLYVPSSQPNPYWIGALQMYLSCPSGNVNNQYVGQVELTGLAQNQFSTLRFPLPAQTTSTLQRSLTDCAFSFALNVNQVVRVWELDNLRFTP